MLKLLATVHDDEILVIENVSLSSSSGDPMSNRKISPRQVQLTLNRCMSSEMLKETERD